MILFAVDENDFGADDESVCLAFARPVRDRNALLIMVAKDSEARIKNLLWKPW